MPKAVPPDKIHIFYEKNLQQLIDALEVILNPTVEEYLCYEYAMDLFAEYERHGNPEPGGYYDQPAQYMYIVECIRTARDRVEQRDRQREAYEGFLKEQEAEEKQRESAPSEI